jgi:tetratricopeptide (TPR) repeat protein
MTAKKYTIHGFLNEFKRRHDQMKDRPFCWVLGSGASVQSGIPTGRKLANDWLKELHELEDSDNLSIEEWATAANLGITGFNYSRAENFYPWIYQRRFGDYKEQGYAFLENVMDHAEPSFGYSVLAQIMATTHHKVAVTTNFDNLIADALSIYTRTFPLVCGHESLTGYIRPKLRRPLVAKVHRDLLLAPLSNPDEIAALPSEWAEALKRIFESFTPIVIGYGGNDGSLMGFLTTLAPIEGGIFWCYRDGSEIDSKIHEVVEHHRGRLVPIAGFDELMLQLQEKLQLPFLLPQLKSLNDKRVADYQRQFEALTAALRRPAENAAAEEARKPVRKAAEAAVERLTKEKEWWAWQLKANAESDPAKKEAIFRAGLEDFPDSGELTGNFANFMKKVRKEYDEAERFYRKALELDPNNALHTGNFANFMRDVRKEYDEAERLYRKALELDPNDAVHTGNFASFMKDVRKDYDEAERLYRKALEVDPNNANATGSFAIFMANVRKDYVEAERLYRKALEFDPTNANYTGNLAQFLGGIDRLDEARELASRAWQQVDKEPSGNTADVTFTLWLLDRAAARVGLSALARLKTVLQAGFARTTWSFDHLLATLLPHISEDERALAQKLADAILDESKVGALEDEPLWQAVEPIALDVPWPD